MLFLKKNFYGIALILITLLAAIIRLPLLGEYPMDRDELARVAPEFTFTSLIPPGIFALTKFSGSLLNYSDFGFRFPIFLFGVFGVITIYFLGKTFFGKLEGILAAIVLTLLLNHIIYSNQVKEYVPLITFASLSSIFAFKIISYTFDKKKIPKRVYLFYGTTNLLALLFSSYFYFLALWYQIIIIFFVKISVNFKKRYFRKILFNFPLNLLVGVSFVFFIFLAQFLLIQMDKYFGLKVIMPTFSFIEKYWNELGYFVTQDTVWAKFTNTLFLVGIIFLLPFKKFRRGAVYIISFTALDFLFTSSLRFSHSAFPLQYIRYHAFLLPVYLVMVTGVVGGLVFLLKRKYPLIAILIIFGFLAFNVKRAYPMIRFYYEVASGFIMPNFKDDGLYLTANLKTGDTLVRVKNPGMDHKFNHVNHYIDHKVLENINYAVFPERTAKNNWYAPLGVGDEDEQGFSDYLYVERIRSSLRPNTPLISKLKYFGPFLKTRLLKDKDSWQIKTSTNQEAASLAIDQDINTFWEGAVGARDYFLVDLGKIHILNSVRFNFQVYFPEQLTLFLSEDNLSKQQVFNYDSKDSPYQNHQIFFAPTKARFITVELKNAGIREINASEVYDDKIDIDREEVFVGESVVKYNFTNNPEGWIIGRGINNLKVKNKELSGRILSQEKEANISISFDSKTKIPAFNFINFALKVNKGSKAELILKTQDKEFLIDNIELIPNGLLNYYSANLDDYGVPEEDRDKIQGLILFPSDASDVEFGLDFLSLDVRNLPGIQIKDIKSPNGFSQFIPYGKDDDYTFFQIGNKLNLPKGKYVAHFKVSVDKIDYDWMAKREPPPIYRLHEYLEPKDNSDNDILYVSLESTRGTFYNSPAYMNIRGEEFREPNKYYEFSMSFKSDGKETLFFQAFNPRNRRYPANLFITYPEIERVE